MYTEYNKLKPLAIDLYAGLGGWTEGLLATGYRVVGFDIERHQYGDAKYPSQLVLQDVLTTDGSQFRDAALIVASPPCQAYSYMAMPWSRAKTLATWHRCDPGGHKQKKLNALFASCFRIQREASVAANRHIPLVVENVKGAQPWVGRSNANYGSFHLWGDIATVNGNIIGLGRIGFDVPMLRAPGRSAVKNGGNGSWFNIAHGQVIPGNQAGAPQRGDGLKAGIKAGGDWFSGSNGGFSCDKSQMRQHSSKSSARRAASAEIAKIPHELSEYVGRFYHPGAR